MCIFTYRNRLSEEKEWLVQDLKFLQECIEDENDATSVSHEEPAEPSIGGKGVFTPTLVMLRRSLKPLLLDDI